MTKDNIIDDPAVLIDIGDNDLDKGEWGLTHRNSYILSVIDSSCTRSNSYSISAKEHH